MTETAEERSNNFEDDLLQTILTAISQTRLKPPAFTKLARPPEATTVGGVLTIDELLAVAHAVRNACPSLLALQKLLGQPDEEGSIQLDEGVLVTGQEGKGMRIPLRPGDVVEITATYSEGYWRLFHLENAYLARKAVGHETPRPV